ncbi:PDZ domain-containing protein [Siminovitchia fortis]|uniref:PDZ domain-containing protein n=1 Tax=Siminovitchia fortis TaxID=254758 RepID=A0A443IKB9_9BACI|nr:PDZ domain-containing protein [Siminovitchia fortis]RWR05040.1 PDZ domain-containing protein [Siminovitchia fortis]WHY81985.1 PDZ domain-containing protein [Siminovitchia fortis]
MVQLWLFELAKGIGRLFLNPVLYFSILLVLFAGFIRIKRERNDFNVRVHDQFHELKHLLPAGLLAGMSLSIITIITGLTIPLEMFALIAITTILLGVIGNARLLSPAYTVGLPILIVFTITFFSVHIPYTDTLLENSRFLIGIPILLGVLLLSEGILMLKNGLKDVSPKLRTSRRGLTIGALQIKRVWLLPIFFFLPAGPLTAPFDWWPVIDWGTETYSLILVPFALGFQNQVQSSLPSQAVERLAKQIILLGVIILAASSAGFYYQEYIPPVIAGIAILGRLFISYRHRVRENNTLYYFTPRNSGVMILDIIPGTPASKMELKTGEIIQACNNVAVSNKDELYKALLKNRAYCKLEVLDVKGEIRFEQCALYEGDHHELGILFVEKRSKGNRDRAM